MAQKITTSGESNAWRGAPMRACSSCAGDYEDPERMAWSAGPEDEQDDDESESGLLGDGRGEPCETGAHHAEGQGVSCEVSGTRRKGGEGDAEEEPG